MKKTRETNTYFVLYDQQRRRWFIRHCNRDGFAVTIGLGHGGHGYASEKEARQYMERYYPKARFVTGTPSVA